MSRALLLRVVQASISPNVFQGLGAFRTNSEIAAADRKSSPAHPFGTWGHRRGTHLGVSGGSEKPQVRSAFQEFQEFLNI